MIKLLNIFSKKRPAMTLKEYMRREGISNQYQLADRLGVSASMLSLYLTGKHPFGSKTALRISKLTGIPVRNLITLQERSQ